MRDMQIVPARHTSLVVCVSASYVIIITLLIYSLRYLDTSVLLMCPNITCLRASDRFMCLSIYVCMCVCPAISVHRCIGNDATDLRPYILCDSGEIYDMQALLKWICRVLVS